MRYRCIGGCQSPVDWVSCPVVMCNRSVTTNNNEELAWSCWGLDPIIDLWRRWTGLLSAFSSVSGGKHLHDFSRRQTVRTYAGDIGFLSKQDPLLRLCDLIHGLNVHGFKMSVKKTAGINSGVDEWRPGIVRANFHRSGLSGEIEQICRFRWFATHLVVVPDQD